MAQPAVDLPDPLNGGNLAGVANADDLLSQLAGDEIDRLLAEAEADAAPALTSPAAASSAPAEPPAAVQSSADASLDAVLAESAPAEPLGVAVEEQAAPADCLGEIERGPIASAPDPEAEPDHDPDAVELAEATALHPHATRAVRRPARVGLLIKPLLWINAPFAQLTEPARELIGKIALVTLINAVAVLAYVWMFTRHHH